RRRQASPLSRPSRPPPTARRRPSPTHYQSLLWQCVKLAYGIVQRQMARPSPPTPNRNHPAQPRLVPAPPLGHAATGGGHILQHSFNPTAVPARDLDQHRRAEEGPLSSRDWELQAAHV